MERRSTAGIKSDSVAKCAQGGTVANCLTFAYLPHLLLPHLFCRLLAGIQRKSLPWIALFSLISSTPAFSQQHPAQLYKEAQAAQATGDYKTAVQKYEAIIRLRPDMAEAFANIGTLYYLLKQHDQAFASFKKAIQLKPELPGPYFFLGVLSFNARAYDESLKYLKRAESLDPSNFLIHSYLGYTYFARSSFLEASQHLEKAAALEGADPDVFYHLSKAYGNLAKQTFGSLQEKFKGSVYTTLARAHSYEIEQNWELAKEQYARALEKLPGNERLQQKLRWLTARAFGTDLSSPDGGSSADELIDGSLVFLYTPPAGAQINQDINQYQNRVRALRDEAVPEASRLYTLAEAYQILSYLASLRVFEIDPDSYRAHQLKGQYYEALNKDNEAIAEYRKAVELKPDLRNVHFLIGNLFWKKNQLGEALRELQHELKSDPNHPQALYEIGDILLTGGKLKEAEEYLLKVLKLEPKMIETHLALEQIYSASGLFDKSLIHLQKAVEIDDKNPTPHYRMFTLYRKLGKSDEAQRELELFKKMKAAEDIKK